ncbi:hypothetical protein ACHDL8_002521 [Clostridioides difficile]|uniref:hypothetical protein n=1 Tax=Clostridioides difficile TaxID=1496 RepID=UPI00093E2B03|nr:hypothetical protein [Clostridioides difficile]EGT3641217.1 hypothetical protein [Clostridioides difficile]EGT3758140.1 hypothetical protein [Clostridioides difficile]EGT5074706.1 hypothetical protein [Clostridioides difficile]EII6771866.1 hypothetical protein [Clostridioides difficile]ELX4553678.1 hypothetical protein [Clostridioides difficile]
MTNKEMCKLNNLNEREVYKSFGKEICASCKSNKGDCESKDCDTAYKNWLEDIYYV